MVPAYYLPFPRLQSFETTQLPIYHHDATGAKNLFEVLGPLHGLDCPWFSPEPQTSNLHLHLRRPATTMSQILLEIRLPTNAG